MKSGGRFVPKKLAGSRKRILLLIVVLGIAALGIVFKLYSSASIFTASAELENGVASQGATAVNDSSASAGRAVRFNAPRGMPVIANLPTQSAALAYNSNMTNVSQYAKPGGLVVAGRDNYQNQDFKDVSAHGGSVLLYLDVMIDSTYGRYQTMLISKSECGAAVPRWPGNLQANSYGYLNDFRVGSVLQSKLECVLTKMVAENPHMAGWFADDLGSRSYFPNFNWDALSATDKQSYRDGAIALTQTFRKVANKYGLVFIVNGTWGAGSVASAGGGYPDANKPGNALADGGFVENHDASQIAYFKSYACSTQWAAQSPVTRGKAINYSVNNNATDMAAYRNSGCFAFSANQPDYDVAPAPYSALHATNLPSKVGTAL